MKKTIVILIMAVLCTLKINAQVKEVTPVNSDGKSKYMPIVAYTTPMNVNVEYSFSQSIYLASDIANSGEITKLTYYLDSDPNLDGTWKNWQVKLGHIDENKFESTSTSAYSPDRYESYMNIVEVFSGDIEYDKTKKEVTINLTKPFQYDGTRNLLIEVTDKSSGKYSEDVFFKTKTYSSKVMSIYDFNNKDIKWSYWDTVSKPTKVPVVKITIDTGVKNPPTEPIETKVNTSQIYCGSSTTSDAPVSYSDYDGDNSWISMLYKPKKIGASGKINRVSFFTTCKVNGKCKFSTAKNQKIYMKEVDYLTHQNNNEPDVSVSNGYKLVYDGSVTWKRGISIEDSETVITLNTPFEYSGNKTLAIYYLNENGGELDASYLGGCSKFPYFLWDSEADTVLSENFGPYKHYNGDTGSNDKKGVGSKDNVLPVMRIYFGEVSVKDDFKVDKVKLFASLDEVKADGIASSVITVVLYNSSGNIIKYDDHNIKLTTNLGRLGDGFVDANGNFSFYIVSDEIGAATITGTVDKDPIGESVEVRFKKDPKPTPNPPSPTDPTDQEDDESSNPSKIEVNQVFSPNGDDKNDKWVLTPNVLTKYPNNSLKVYNRHGNLVYEASPYNNEWDGVSNGKITISKKQKVPVGSYYYIFNTGDNYTQDGWIYINY